MNTSEKDIHFGDILKKNRIEKNLGYEEISEMTKISKENLLYIENGDHENLPESIYVKGYINAYANALEIDSTEIIEIYNIDYQDYKGIKKSDSKKKLILKKDRFSIFIITCLSIISLLIFFLVYMFFNNNSNSSNNITVNIKIDKKKDIPKSINLHEINTNDKKFEKKILKVTAIEETWIKIIIDGQLPKKYNLKNGDIFELEAYKSFNLLVGSATGIILSYNGKDVNINGKTGQIINIKIP